MLDFNFKNPTNILFGKGKITVIKESIPAESGFSFCMGERQEITLDVSKKILELSR
ncbi:hypothetical protein [Desulfobacula sp.]